MKNTISHIQDNVSAKAQHPTTAPLEYCKIAKAQDRDLQIAFVNMIWVCIEEIDE